MAQDSSRADFWETRYQQGVIPWDAGQMPSQFVAFAAARPPGERVLAPGCGSGYEVRGLAEHGAKVLAVDFSAAAVARAREVLGSTPTACARAIFFSWTTRRLIGCTSARCCARCRQKPGTTGRRKPPAWCAPAACWPGISLLPTRPRARRLASARRAWSSCWAGISPWKAASRPAIACRCLPGASTGWCGVGAEGATICRIVGAASRRLSSPPVICGVAPPWR